LRYGRDDTGEKYATARACGQPRAPLKPRRPLPLFRSRAMIAIGVIALFLLVIMGLNLTEFGRID
jgi:hypothetical protein